MDPYLRSLEADMRRTRVEMRSEGLLKPVKLPSAVDLFNVLSHKVSTDGKAAAVLGAVSVLALDLIPNYFPTARLAL